MRDQLLLVLYCSKVEVLPRNVNRAVTYIDIATGIALYSYLIGKRIVLRHNFQHFPSVKNVLAFTCNLRVEWTLVRSHLLLLPFFAQPSADSGDQIERTTIVFAASILTDKRR